MSLALLPSPGILATDCRSRNIRRLALFGPAMRADPERSDIDLLVKYEEGRHPGLDHFLGAEELSGIFGHKVDLNSTAMPGSLPPAVSKSMKPLFSETEEGTTKGTKLTKNQSVG